MLSIMLDGFTRGDLVFYGAALGFIFAGCIVLSVLVWKYFD